MIQIHVGAQTLVFPLQEVFGAPDPDGAVVRAGRQILPVTAEVQTRHVRTVALKNTDTKALRTGFGRKKPEVRQTQKNTSQIQLPVFQFIFYSLFIWSHVILKVQFCKSYIF